MSKMAGNFKVGDLVWAKMKGFPNWPGKVIAPKPEVKRPANKKNQQFVFFFGSENYAWIQEENMHIYADNKTRFLLSQRIPRGYKEAVEAIEDALKACPTDVNLKTSDLPSIEEELAQIFPQRKDAPQRDYSRDSGRKRKKSPPPLSVPAKAKTPKDRRSQVAPPASIRDRRRSSHDDQKKNGKNNTAGVRVGKDATPAGKDATKTKKVDRVSTPKALPKSSSKVLHKSAKKIRKVKTDNSESPESTKSEPTEPKIANDTESSKAKDSNHNDGDSAEPGFLAEEEACIPEPQESDTKVKTDERSESPELFGSEVDGDVSGGQNGPGEPENKTEQTAPSDNLADEGENGCSAGPSSFGVDADDPPAEPVLKEKSPPPPPPVVIAPKEPTSARGENIFEMFASKDNALIYNNEEVVEEEEEDKPEDDGVEYAVVTVDPDGQAHVLLNAETIIDDEVVVLGQEEEVETEGVEADTISNEVIDSEMNDSEVIESEVVESEVVDSEVIEKTEEVALDEASLPGADVAADHDSSHEEIDLQKESHETEEPESELQPESETSADPVETSISEKAPEVEATPSAEEEAEKQSVETGEKSFAAELEAAEAAADNIFQVETLEEPMETEHVDQEVEVPEKEQAVKEEMQDKEAAESKAESTDGAQSDGSSRTPSRRSTRMRIRKEEVKDIPKKREPKPAVVGKTERKSKDSLPKTPAVRRHSGKRPASPLSTPSSTKRSKLVSKAPASPGRSAAPAEYKPLGGLPLDTIEPAVAGQAKQDVIPTPLKIGFLGLGIMGTGMVAMLLKSGHEVTVWNRTAQKCREFMKEGALKGNTPAEVVAACDVTFSCVSDPAAVKDLVFGNCGVLQGIQPGKGYIEMSTIDPDTVADVHEAVTSQGGRFLEAPVVGSRGPANTGQLVILAAGDRTLYEDCYSCFEAMGKKTFFLGETTSGCKMKLVVNMLMGTCVAGLAESLALADKVGLDQDALLQILDLSVMSCPLIRAKGQAIMMSRFEPQFPLQHQQKDMRLSINMADSVDQPLHVATSVNELFKKAKAKGYSQHDMCAVYRAADM